VAIDATISSLSTLGDRLKAERDRLGWSREDMAGFGAVSNASQRLYDASNRVPAISYLLLLAKSGADFNYLLHAERADSVTETYLHITEETADKVFRLAWHIWQTENGRVSSVDEAAKLFVSVLKQVHVADDPGVDLKMLAAASSAESGDL